MSQTVTNDVHGLITSVAERFFTVKKFAERNRQQGTWPESESAIWAIRAGSPANGFGDAFITIGRRVLINEENFWKAVAHLQETDNDSNR